MRGTSGATTLPLLTRRPASTSLRRLLATMLLACGAFAAAQECTYESELNDLVGVATVVTGAGPDSLAPATLNPVGQACRTGALGAGDTDVFVWKPGELEAGHRWLLEVESDGGQPVSVTLAVATLADDGRTVISATDLLEVATPDGARARSTEFLVNNGATYVLRFTGSAGTYVAGIRPVSALRYGTLDERFEVFSPGRATAAPLAGHAFLDGALVQSFTVSAEMAGFQWDFELWAPLGAQAQFSLTGPSGQVAGAAVGVDGYARVADLALPQGAYELTLSGAAGVPTTVRFQLEAAGRVLNGAGVEPNDVWTLAGLVRPGDSVTGALSGVDYYRLEVDGAQAGRPWDVSLDSDADVRLGIRDRWGRELRESRAGDAAGLTLAPGAYRVLVEGPTGAAYRLSVNPAASVAGDLEPNDAIIVATPVGPSGTVAGEFTGRDTDVFELTVTSQATLYGIRLDSSGSEWLRLLDSEGATVVETRGTGTLRLDDLLLMPGVHHVAIRGSDAQYDL
ncbi:MAG TPA: hypothetical protein VFN03_04690, partial [Trueperaceae bacterium]|nr:hypothetical protein [Trueperaceae bacterium]